MSENNKKMSPLVAATAGALGGVIMLAGALGILQSIQPQADQFAFVTQQFLVANTPIVSAPTTTVSPNPGGTVAQPNPNPQVAPPTTPAPVLPVVPLFWTSWFNFVLGNPANSNSPTCKVNGTVVNGNVPGIVGYTAVTNPSNPNNPKVLALCALLNSTTNQVLAVGTFNNLSSNFNNLPALSYKVVCLTWFAGTSPVKANFCSSGPHVIANTPVITAVPGGPGTAGGSIDLELFGSANPVFNSPTNTSQATSVTYEYTIKNVGGSDAQGLTLRVTPQNFLGISAPNAVQNGNQYIWKIPLVSANGSVAGFTLQGKIDPSNPNPTVIAELCDYSNDVDSKPCNVINLNINGEDDELKL